MDANKLEKLKQIKYRIRDCCGLCIHADLAPDGWGTCLKFTYNHLKHKEERQLSIHMFGSCGYFIAEEDKIGPLRKMELYEN